MSHTSKDSRERALTKFSGALMISRNTLMRKVFKQRGEHFERAGYSMKRKTRTFWIHAATRTSIKFLFLFALMSYEA